jgi:hypothetical protein
LKRYSASFYCFTHSCCTRFGTRSSNPDHEGCQAIKEILEILENLENLGSVENQGSREILGNLESLEILESLVSLETLGSRGTLGSLEILGSQVNVAHKEDVEKMGNRVRMAKSSTLTCQSHRLNHNPLPPSKLKPWSWLKRHGPSLKPPLNFRLRRS